MVLFDRFLYNEQTQKLLDFVAVALNFGERVREVELTLPWPGHWQDLLSDAQYQVEQNCWLTLAPWEPVVLVYAGKRA